MGDLAPDSGEARLTAGVTVGYLPQAAPINEALTVQQLIDTAIGARDQVKADLIRLEAELGLPGLSAGALQKLLTDYAQVQEAFSQLGGYDGDYRIDQVFSGLGVGHIARERPVHSLSGGEQTRVMLAGLLLRAPDLL